MILYMGSYYGKGLLKIDISVSKCPYRFEIPFLIVANVKFTGRKLLCDTIPGYFVHQRMFTSMMPDINIKPIRAYYNFQNNSAPFSTFWDLSKSGRKEEYSSSFFWQNWKRMLYLRENMNILVFKS